MNKYLILTVRKTSFQPSVLEAHYDYLNQLRTEGRLEISGPFTDKSGGAYVLNAENMAQAENLAFADPLYVTNSSTVTIYEWNAE